jgi:two-component system NtrC family sensor kinase
MRMSVGSDDDGQKPGGLGGFRSRLALVVVVISLVPMLLVSGVTLYQFDSFANQTVHAHLEELVLKHRQTIDDFLSERLKGIDYLARTDDPVQLQDTEILGQRLQTLQEAYGDAFVDLGLIDERGIQVSYSGPFDVEGADYGETDWFQEASQRE